MGRSGCIGFSARSTESGWWVTRGLAGGPQARPWTARASRSAARFSSTSAYLLTRALAARFGQALAHSSDPPRESATFASFFFGDRGPCRSSRKPNSQRERLHGVACK
jgi:hypothetical protein